ncbi:GCN5-related N-acetyltransferase [Arcobacter nitrofigilis DSM 7299]|jgi:ribosomal protein S18 acetylase RimI-like enzyme|uniref:GCN5-related N-acetyltransferase n=1 Tax=Arcobacter nitrofigilis (strain ATCC 33309 / DSM 7299 / CCUG 15893 / LMG 7604 / NCTC 12251 / CI) TaxID=572480 RepID=D5V3I6_ARCNC|nr:GNAT family N-acetyltransferase [Arcobacter nitrofigilis]ADG91697.1 GCN5-related N-acetyltransferase [Arcobacter nitrofigilis DSM 7299]|tara:strand:- start:330 stop:794 length:465 start_codon:yes stop_codon:yes gene_type:complete
MILKNNLQICKATNDDLPDLINLLQSLFTIEQDFTFNEKKHEEGIILLINNKSSEVILVKFENEVIGMITIQKIISTVMGTKVGLIEDFIIKDDYRDLGVGTYLLEYIKDYAKKHSLTRLQLVCDEDNTTAKEFYTNKKFKRSNLNAWYYTLDK